MDVSGQKRSFSKSDRETGWPGLLSPQPFLFFRTKNSDTVRGDILCLKKYHYQGSAIQNGSV